MPNPLPEHLENRAHEQKVTDDAKRPLRVVAMTRLVDGKGVDLAVEAMAHLSTDFCLQVAGDGPERQALEEQSKCQGVSDRCSFSAGSPAMIKIRF